MRRPRRRPTLRTRFATPPGTSDFFTSSSGERGTLAAFGIAAGGAEVAALLADQRRRLAFRAARQMLHGAAAIGQVDHLAARLGDEGAALGRGVGQEADGD